MSDSYKIYASKDYVDSKSLPDGQGAYQQLVTDAEGNVKWEDKLAYTTSPVEVVLMDAQTVEFTINGGNGVAPSPVIFELTAGNEYTVLFDDAAYQTTALSADGGVVYIGNSIIFGLEDTGAPFTYATMGSVALWSSYDEAVQHTIEVRGIESEVVTVPHKYIPEATDDQVGGMKKNDVVGKYNFQSSIVEVDKLRKAIADFREGKAIVLWRGGFVISADLIDDDICVLLSGRSTIYRYKPSEHNGVMVYNSTLWIAEEQLFAVPADIPTPTTASVGQAIVVKSVDENGKPTEWETIDPWVITSPNGTQFKLTIDDEGILSAAELV